MPPHPNLVLLEATAATDFADADLGDKRRNRRLVSLVEALRQRPEASVPEALCDEAEQEAYYRLMRNEAVRWQDLLAPHQQACAARAVELEEVLVSHDTTECEWKRWDEGVRQHLAHPSSRTQGFGLHTSLVTAAVSHDGHRLHAPLGFIHLQPFVHHGELPRDETLEQAQAYWQQQGGLYDQGEEGCRWHEAVVAAEDRLRDCQRVIHLMDREADAYNLLYRMQVDGLDHVIRMTRPATRRVSTGPRRADYHGLSQEMAREPWRGQRAAQVGWRPARNARKDHGRRTARTAHVSVRSRQVKLRRPNQLPARLYPGRLEVWVVEVLEREPPAGQEPLHWVLLSSQPCETEEACWQVVDWYRARWVAEEGYDVFKNGCGVKDLQHRKADTLLNAMAIRLVMSWELLTLRYLSREAPDLSASVVVDALEELILREEAPRGLVEEATVADVLAAVARLGGHRRSNGAPGWKILGRGWVRLKELKRGARVVLRMQEQQRDLPELGTEMKCDQS